MIGVGLLNEGAFISIGAYGADRHLEPKIDVYPFTKALVDELGKGSYQRFREGKVFGIVRDIFAAVGFILSVLLTLKELLHW